MERFVNVNETVQSAGDFETITAAIKLACENGCRAIKIPRFNARTGETKWSVAHAVELPSDFTVYLDNCFVEQAKGSYENLFVNEHVYDGEYLKDPAHCVKNIKIIGEGHTVLSGGEHNHLLEKTVRHYHLPGSMFNQNLLRFWNVDGLEVSGIVLKDYRWWSVVHEHVKNAVYKNIHFEVYPHVPNMDGIDMRLGCSNFSFENITGKTGDDVIAFTGLRGKMEDFQHVEGESIDIHDCKIRNLKAHSHRCYLVRFLNHDGCREYNMDLDTLMDASDLNSFQPSIGVGIGSPFYFHYEKAKPGDTGRIRVKNLYSRGYACMRICHVCEDTVFSNVHTFGACRYMLDSEADGMELKNIRLEHLYYSVEQPKYPDGRTVEPDKYMGCLVELPNTAGDVSISHVETDPIGKGISVSGGACVRVSGLETALLVEPVKKDEGSTVEIS